MSSVNREATLEALASSDSARQASALVDLEAGGQELDAELVDALLPLLAESRKEISRRAAGLLSRVAKHEDPQRRLFTSLGSSSPLERWGAAFALASAGILDGRVGDAALATLALDDGDIRWAAAGIVRAVAQIDSSFFARLLSTAQDSAGPQRKMCIYCLRDLGHDEPAVYIRALAAPDVGTRQAALSGLQSCGEATDEALAAALARLEAETDPGVRRSLAIVLGRIGGAHEEALSALRRAAGDTDDVDFKRAVALVLRRN